MMLPWDCHELPKPPRRKKTKKPKKIVDQFYEVGARIKERFKK